MLNINKEVLQKDDLENISYAQKKNILLKFYSLKDINSMSENKINEIFSLKLNSDFDEIKDIYNNLNNDIKRYLLSIQERKDNTSNFIGNNEIILSKNDNNKVLLEKNSIEANIDGSTSFIQDKRNDIECNNTTKGVSSKGLEKNNIEENNVITLFEHGNNASDVTEEDNKDLEENIISNVFVESIDSLIVDKPTTSYVDENNNNLESNVKNESPDSKDNLMVSIFKLGAIFKIEDVSKTSDEKMGNNDNLMDVLLHEQVINFDDIKINKDNGLETKKKNVNTVYNNTSKVYPLKNSDIQERNNNLKSIEDNNNSFNSFNRNKIETINNENKNSSEIKKIEIRKFDDKVAKNKKSIKIDTLSIVTRALVLPEDNTEGSSLSTKVIQSVRKDYNNMVTLPIRIRNSIVTFKAVASVLLSKWFLTLMLCLLVVGVICCTITVVLSILTLDFLFDDEQQKEDFIERFHDERQLINDEIQEIYDNAVNMKDVDGNYYYYDVDVSYINSDVVTYGEILAIIVYSKDKDTLEYNEDYLNDIKDILKMFYKVNVEERTEIITTWEWVEIIDTDGNVTNQLQQVDKEVYIFSMEIVFVEFEDVLDEFGFTTDDKEYIKELISNSTEL